MQTKRTIPKSELILKIAAILLIATLPFVVLYFALQSQFKTIPVSVDGITVHAQVATTSREKERGLCCREQLPADQGMLFVYEKPGDYDFWMKDTKIPLDIYWMNAQKKIVHIEHSVQPSSYPKSFGSDTPSQYILETNAGFAKSHNIQVGDIASFTL